MNRRVGIPPCSHVPLYNRRSIPLGSSVGPTLDITSFLLAELPPVASGVPALCRFPYRVGFDGDKHGPVTLSL